MSIKKRKNPSFACSFGEVLNEKGGKKNPIRGGTGKKKKGISAEVTSAAAKKGRGRDRFFSKEKGEKNLPASLEKGKKEMILMFAEGERAPTPNEEKKRPKEGRGGDLMDVLVERKRGGESRSDGAHRG